MAYIPLSNLSDTPCEKSKARPQNFSERLRYALHIRNMTQAELCEKTNVDKSTMSQYANGSFEPRRERLERIAAALDINEPWLMGWAVPLTKYDGTPEVLVTVKQPDNKDQSAKVIDLLYSQMEAISEVSKVAEPEELSALSNSMTSVAKILLKYIQ